MGPATVADIWRRTIAANLLLVVGCLPVCITETETFAETLPVSVSVIVGRVVAITDGDTLTVLGGDRR